MAVPPVVVPTPGVAKIVKLGGETLLVIEVRNGNAVAEGEYDIKAIKSAPTGPGGAGDCVVAMN